MEKIERIKILTTTIISTFMAWLGILAIPVLLMVGCNVIDYFTAIPAAKYRGEKISSYKGITGIRKKIYMWVLVIIGAFIDVLINYATQYIGLQIQVPFIVATVVAVWIVCNEIISILENMLDIGVDLPPFLMPLVKNIKKQVEDKTNLESEGQ